MSKRDLRRSLFGVGSLKLASAGFAFLQTIVLARLLGVDQFGVYSLVLAVVTVLTVPLIRGFPTLVVRTAAQIKGTGDFGALARLVRVSDVVGLLAVGVIAALLLVFANFSVVIPRGELDTLAMACFAMLLTLMANVRSAVTWGLGSSTLGHLPDQVIRPLALLLALVGLSFLGPVTAFEAMIATVMSGVVTLVAAYSLLDGKRLWTGYTRFSRPEAWSVVKILLPLSSIAGMQMLNSQLDVIVLGAFRAESEVGIYKLAATISAQVSIGLLVAGAVYSPTFASLYKAGKLEELRGAFRSAARMATLVGLLAFVVVLVIAIWGIEIGLPEEFADAKWPTLVLAAVHLGTLWAGGANTVLVMAGEERYVMRTVGIATLVKMAISFPAVIIFGVWGAVAATIVSLALWRFLIWKRYHQIIISGV